MAAYEPDLHQAALKALALNCATLVDRRRYLRGLEDSYISMLSVWLWVTLGIAL